MKTVELTIKLALTTEDEANLDVIKEACEEGLKAWDRIPLIMAGEHEVFVADAKVIE